MLKLITFLGFFLCSTLTAAPVDLGKDFAGKQFGHDLSIFRDASGTMPVDQVWEQTFAPSEKMTPNLGFTPDILWVSFELHNPGDKDVPLLLEYRYASADFVELFQKEGAGFSSVKMGDKVPYESRSFKSRYPIFELNVPSGTHRYLMRIETEGTTIAPLFFWNKAAFQPYMLRDGITLGILFGILFAMLAYNLFLFVSFKSRIYLFYVAYMCFFTMHALSAQGLSYILVGSNSHDHWWSNQGFVVFAELASIFMALFSMHFLDIKNRHPIIYKLCLVHRGISILDIINVQFHSYELAAKIANLNVAFVSCLMITAGAISIYRRYRPAYFYTVAWSFYLLGAVVMVLKYQGVLPLNALTEYGNLFGACAEAILISIALGDRVNHYRNKAEAEIHKLNADLKLHIEHVEELVEDKTRDIRSILKNIHQGIFMIEADGRMHAEYSDYLCSILGEKPGRTEPAFDILFRHANVDSDTRAMNQNIIETSLNADVFNFEANHSHLLRAAQLKMTAGTRDVELDWVPIITDANHVSKLLVSVRDVTEIKQLTRESEEHRRTLELIERIISFPASKFDSFFESAKDLLASCQRLMESASIDLERARHLSRNLHTLKGLTRAFGFKEISSRIHEMEHMLHDTVKNQKTEGLPTAPVYMAFESIEEDFQELFFINYTRLGREYAKQDHKPAEIRSLIASINSLVSAIERGTPQAGLSQLKDTLVKDLFFNMSYLLQDLNEGLDKSVNRLGIKKPTVTVLGDSFHFYP
ncbi:MAG TPA: 7TM diverse intracellular signaling domain-containing protein, partial [Oligoflexus sp.]|uniref:7TM diverse intracellular signaling domain-containing protein n=1 Tax=Oligoflexus sp. TaxID=1971216 RepID=UPI002D802474